MKTDLPRKWLPLCWSPTSSEHSREIYIKKRNENESHYLIVFICQKVIHTLGIGEFKYIEAQQVWNITHEQIHYNVYKILILQVNNKANIRSYKYWESRTSSMWLIVCCVCVSGVWQGCAVWCGSVLCCESVAPRPAYVHTAGAGRRRMPPVQP